MTAVLLMAVAAAISVGYLSTVTELAVRKLNEVPAVRRTVETIFLFSLVDSMSRWAESQEASTLKGWISGFLPDGSQIAQWFVIAAVVIAVALSLYFAALGIVIKLFLWFIVVVLAGLWFVFRSK